MVAKRQLMFRRCRNTKTDVITMQTFDVTAALSRALPALIAVSVLYGCRERQPATPPSPTTTTSASTQSNPPVSSDSAADSVQESDDAVKAEAALAGVPTQYAAHFDSGQLKHIDEARKSAGAGSQTGEYIFYGARLMQYRGAALSDNSTIELNFDMQGGLTSANTSAGKSVSDQEIRAIRNRAQLLRSAALARRSTQAHAMH